LFCHFTPLACYNFGKREPILIIFGRNANKEACKQRCFVSYLTELVLLHHLTIDRIRAGKPILKKKILSSGFKRFSGLKVYIL